MILDYENLLPEDIILCCNDDKKSWTFYPSVVDLIDLKYNLHDKLQIVAKFIRCNKAKVFIDCLSDDDKTILKNCLHYNDGLKNNSFWNNLLNTNQIKYQDGLYTKLQEDAACLKKYDRQKYDRQKHENLYKWFSLQKVADKKIVTICDNSVYLPSPIEFNDIFDTQIHISESNLDTLCGDNKNAQHFFKILFTIINYQTRSCSFSLNDSCKLSSNAMWGLYGDLGSGFALSYDIKDVLLCLYKNHIKIENGLTSLTKDGANIINFHKMIYSTYNPHNDLKNIISDANKTNHSHFYEKINNFLAILLRNKSQNWEHGKEIRLWKNNKFNYDLLSLCNSLDNRMLIDEDVILIATEAKNNYMTLIDNNKLGEKFAPANRIILGWDCLLSDENILKLMDYANNQKSPIEIVKLTKKIHYDISEFEKITI